MACGRLNPTESRRNVAKNQHGDLPFAGPGACLNGSVCAIRGWVAGVARRATPVVGGRLRQPQAPLKTARGKQAANGVERKHDSQRRNVPMRYTRLLATLFVALGAMQCLAETPDWSQNQPQAMSILQRTRLFSGPNWYSRYGEPVNAAALEQADVSPSD